MKIATGTLIVMLLAAATASADIVAQYDFTGNTGTEGLLLPSQLHPNVLSSNLNRGLGLTPAALPDSYAAQGWVGTQPNDFFTVSIQPEAGYQVDLTSIDFGVVRGITGSTDTTFELTWSGDGFATVLGSVPLTATATAQTITFATPLTILDQVAFRLRTFGMTDEAHFVALTNQNGAGGLTLNGVVTPVAIPEPGSLVLLSLTGLAAFGIRQFKRRRSRASVSPEVTPA